MTIAYSGDSITYPDLTVQKTAPKVGMVNRIINGAMVIDQRNAGAAYASSYSGYVLDRYNFSQSPSGKLVAQQNAGAVTPPSGFGNYLGFTSQSAYTVTSGDYYTVEQRIEGFNTSDLMWGTASAQTVTISFWVRSSLTGTFGAALQNSATTRSYPFTYTISAANTWEQKSVTVAGDTSGTWVGATNGIGLNLIVGMGVGSGYSGTAGAWASANYKGATGAVSVVGVSGATFYITGVQLEKGSTATSFDYRPYGTELGLCQRYLPALISSGTVDFIGYAQAGSATAIYPIIQHPVTPRVAPTGLTASAGTILTVNGVNASSAIALANGGLYASRIVVTTTGLTNQSFYGLLLNTSGSKLLFTGCEL